MVWMHVLQVETEGLVARVTLNDIEVFADWEGARRVAQTKLDPYLLEGDNRLDVALTPMTDDDGKVVPGDRALSVTLIRGEHGVDPGPAGRLAQFAWKDGDTPVELGVLTSVWARQFSVRPEHAHGRWAWQDAPARPPTEEDARALVALTADVHAALAARDAARLFALTALRDRELARALGLTEEENRAELENYYAEWFGEPDWTMEPFDPMALAATAFARGRLVRVTDPHGGPALKGYGGGRRFVFSITATRVDGAWILAR